MSDIQTIIKRLRKQTKKFTRPLVDTLIAERGRDPYMILIACLLSLRAKDSTTIHVCGDLFTRVKAPEQIVAMPLEELELIIFKTGFYHTKACVLKHVSNVLLEKYAGKVPATYQELVAIKGVGPKTANLVLGYAFGILALCVDTHVHRISNRLGLVKTKTPEQTELALQAVVPREHWIEWNSLLVMMGQNICVPVRPKCSECLLAGICPRAGVKESK
ncbi:MAG: endonuclease III [Candidatus Babeliales bacterium]|jgi:endonuclease-3